MIFFKVSILGLNSSIFPRPDFVNKKTFIKLKKALCRWQKETSTQWKSTKSLNKSALFLESLAGLAGSVSCPRPWICKDSFVSSQNSFFVTPLNNKNVTLWLAYYLCQQRHGSFLTPLLVADEPAECSAYSILNVLNWVEFLCEFVSSFVYGI